MLEKILALFAPKNDSQADKAAAFSLPALQWLISLLSAVVLVMCAIFNWQFFRSTAPGVTGYLVGVLALVSGVAAFALWHTISNSSGRFQIAVGISALALTCLDIFHATLQYYKNTALLSRSWAEVQTYAQFGALPVLLIAFVAVGFALSVTHWRHKILVARTQSAETIAVSDETLRTAEIKMANEQALDERRLKHLDAQLGIQKQTIERVAQFAKNREQLGRILASVPDPKLRAELETMFGAIAHVDAFEAPVPLVAQAAKKPGGYVNGKAENTLPN